MELTHFQDIRRVFEIAGEPMQTHPGRSVVRLEVDGHPHYLKRFWLTPRRCLRRFVSQGIHELNMVRWLDRHGFGAPVVVASGVVRRWGIKTAMFFLMRQMEGELALERFFRRQQDDADALLDALAAYTARLHDAGFYHRDYSERHILVGTEEAGFRFRQIDLERATVGPRNEVRAAADLKTLACSVANETLHAQLEGPFVGHYLHQRQSRPDAAQFRRLLDAARPTKTFE